MKYSSFALENSSNEIDEVPSFKIHAVNIRDAKKTIFKQVNNKL